MNFDSCRAKRRLGAYRKALYNYDRETARKEMEALFSHDALVQLAFPFETLNGPDALLEVAYDRANWSTCATMNSSVWSGTKSLKCRHCGIFRKS